MVEAAKGPNDEAFAPHAFVHKQVPRLGHEAAQQRCYLWIRAPNHAQQDKKQLSSSRGTLTLRH